MIALYPPTSGGGFTAMEDKKGDLSRLVLMLFDSFA